MIALIVVGVPAYLVLLALLFQGYRNLSALMARTGDSVFWGQENWSRAYTKQILMSAADDMDSARGRHQQMLMSRARLAGEPTTPVLWLRARAEEIGNG